MSPSRKLADKRLAEVEKISGLAFSKLKNILAVSTFADFSL